MKLGLRKPRRLRRRYGHYAMPTTTIFWEDIPYTAKVVEVPGGWIVQLMNYETGRFEDGTEATVVGAESEKAKKRLRERAREDASK